MQGGRGQWLTPWAVVAGLLKYPEVFKYPDPVRARFALSRVDLNVILAECRSFRHTWNI